MLSVGSIHFLRAPWRLWYGPPKMSALLLCLCRRNARVSSLFHQCRRQIEGRRLIMKKAFFSNTESRVG